MAGERRHLAWAGLATVAVVAALIAAAAHLGSPAERRLRRLDALRTDHLNGLSRAIQEEWEKSGRLPENIAGLARQPWSQVVERDPETAATYPYERIDERRYRLCATFARPSEPPEPHHETEFWVHPAGRHCFELAIEEGQQ
jgi:hypothetical protein